MNLLRSSNNTNNKAKQEDVDKRQLKARSPQIKRIQCKDSVVIESKIKALITLGYKTKGLITQRLTNNNKTISMRKNSIPKTIWRTIGQLTSSRIFINCRISFP